MPCALIQPNYEYVQKWGEKNNIQVGNSIEEMANNKELIDEIQKEIDAVNQGFGNWEKVKKFRLTPEEWTIENGCLTPTLKHKRKNVKEKFIHLYNEMYED